MVASIRQLSSIPSRCDSSAKSHRVSSSTSGSSFGTSPYTLFVDMKTNGESGQWWRTASRRLSVPSAFTSKSSNGRAAARSCDGCAAQ